VRPGMAGTRVRRCQRVHPPLSRLTSRPRSGSRRRH